eukprot:TRINITY_DN1502_c0_g1_i1.p1 TRINITY_DN1502_c0_g1~~TRINITY_DN1502_c0_g1_i1.p1  ORF type:complete len:340 (+),score=77.83 TRINITY_DN1502_c0_g1_i1:91-1110(+)
MSYNFSFDDEDYGEGASWFADNFTWSGILNLFWWCYIIKGIWAWFTSDGVDPNETIVVGSTVTYKGTRKLRKELGLDWEEEGEVKDIDTEKKQYLVHFAKKEKESWLGRSSFRKTPLVNSDITLDHLQPKKQLATSYYLMLFFGLTGAHHFYLEKMCRGLFALFTFNFFGLGQLYDLFMMPSYVRRANTGCTDEDAPSDGSGWKIAWRLPKSVMIMYMLPALLMLYTPWALNRVGVVDIERMSAQTEANPYEILGLGRGASMKDAKMAHRKMSLKYHPDKNPGCGKECDAKMAEIHKAFDAIKLRQAPPPEERTWSRWGSNLLQDWTAVMQALDDVLKT